MRVADVVLGSARQMPVFKYKNTGDGVLSMNGVRMIDWTYLMFDCLIGNCIEIMSLITA